MSAPTITTVTPANNATGVVLGIPIVVTFSSLMNHASINNGSFALQAPGNTMIITPDQDIEQFPKPSTTKVSVPGTFSFVDTTYTVVTFTPTIPLTPNTKYRVVILGANTITAGVSVQDTLGNELAQTYGWTFTTGTLSLSTPPVQSPIIVDNPELNPCDILVVPRKYVLGQDLTQEIVLTFPAPLDQTSFTEEEILLAIEPILGDPTIYVPSSLVTNVTISSNTITILITGWPPPNERLHPCYT